MTRTRCHITMRAHLWRWVFALSLTALLLCRAAVGFALTPAPGTPIVNQAAVQYGDANGNPLSATSNTVSANLSGAPFLHLVKTASSNPVAAGALLTYTLRYENSGNAPATGVTVVDTLPAEVVFQSATAGGVYAAAGRTVTWNPGTVASGGSAILTVTVQTQAGLTAGAVITNSASISSLEGAGAAATVSTTIGAASNLTLEKSGPATATPNGVITYTLSYRNSGNMDAASVRITDQIPVSTAYVPGSATAPGVFSGSSLTWDLGTVAAGAAAEVSFQVRVSPLATAGQQISNVATIISSTEAKTSNTVTATVSSLPRLTFTKTATPSVLAGADIVYTLLAENQGSVPLTNVVLTDSLPAGTTFVAADSGGVASADGRQVVWTIPGLAVGQQQPVTLTLKVSPELATGQIIANSATAVSGETAPQTATAASSVIARTPGSVEFFDAAWQPAYGYMHGDTIYLQVTDLDQNVDPTLAETITVTLTDQNTGDAETVTLTETGPNTGIFRSSGILTSLNATAADDGTLTVVPDSRLLATYTDPLDASPVSNASALIDPLGTVFDSTSGAPITGTVVTLRPWNSTTDACDFGSLPVLPPGQVNPALPTGDDGKFAFPLVYPGDYCFQVTPPTGYVFPSTVADADLPAGFTVGNGSRGEKFTLSVGDPPLIRDIPLDAPGGRLSMAKSANRTAAAVGDFIAYTLKLTSDGDGAVTAIRVTDTMPHGITPLPGSSRLNGQPLADPAAEGNRTFAWSVPDLAAGESLEITYRAVVGPDSRRGDGVNTAFAAGTTLGRPVTSNTARVKVKITEGVFTEKGTILGKVFHDRDGNRLQNQSAGGDLTKPAEPGIGNVVLYLEDGTRVITDSSGKFSILGIMPGTHVLRLDETTLPPGMVLVAISNRFMGDAASQFVTMGPGGLYQADFAVRLLAPENAGTAAAPAAPPSASGIPSAPSAAPVAAETAPPSAASPVEPAAPSVQAPESPTETTAAATPPSPAVKAADRDWEEEIKTMKPDLEFLSPGDGTAVTRDSIRVVLKAPFGMAASLSLNGTEVDAKQLGRKMEYEKGQVTLYEYISVRLNAGEANRLKAEVKDPFGIVRGTREITVTAAGTPERIVIGIDRPEAPADGTSLVRIDVSSRDRNGGIVPFDALATIASSAGDFVETDADPTQEGFQFRLQAGVGQVNLRAPRETGEAQITVELDGRQETAKVFFTPHLRDLFLVGIGEVTIGHGRGKGAYRFLTDDTWFDDGIYSGARGAFFLKGKIFDNVLLTASYDSEKKKRQDLFREDDTRLDGEDKYPIYGDESKTGYEAVSADKLYLKIEEDRSFLLYGDYRTELNAARLAAYNRSFNGLKYELNTSRVHVRAFGSYTDQTQIMDALPGRGISGYYYLSKQSLMEGSERVTVETRDRYRPDNVLSREGRSRGSDYDIDYDLGAILFKEPIPSHDSDYNPVYIVVTYESKTYGDKYYIYGGRGAVRPASWLELGATGVVEEKALGDYRLTGADLTLTLPGKTVIKAEYAETRGLFDDAGILAWRSDNAWSLNLDSKPTDRLQLAGYYRTLGNYFQNISAVDATRGTTKYGFDAVYQLRPDTSVRGQFFDERDDLNDMKHRLGSVGIQTKFNRTKVTAEIANETSSDDYIPTSSATSRSPFDISEETPHESTTARVAVETQLRPDLSLTLSHKQNITGESYLTSQAGLNYQISSKNRLYVREEYQQYQDRDELRTLFGAETQLIRNTVAYNEYRLSDGADGKRNQNVIGLRNKFLLAKNVTGSASAEYLKTVSGSQRENEPDAVALALGLEYLNSERLKTTGRFEHRHEMGDSGRDSWLGEVGLAYKLHPEYSLLLRERYFTEDSDTGGTHTISRLMAGLAYRPLFSNRFSALTRVEYKHESNDASTPAYSEDAWIFSGEAAWRATPRLQLTGKYAGKLLQDQEFSSYTDLVSAGFIYDLTERWDLGGEYRILTSHDISSRFQGGSLEIGYRVMKNLWLSAGYSFDRFDADLAGDGYQGQGAYVKLRVKGDESIIRGLRKAPAADESAPQTAAAAEAAPAVLPADKAAPATAKANIQKAAPLPAATAATAAAGSVPAAAALLPVVSGPDNKGPAVREAAATAASLTTSPDSVESSPEAEEMAVFTIHFASDSSSFSTGEDFATLHTAARLLKSDPTLNAAIEGHCDLRGSQSHNLKLGARRCETVVKELEKVGVKDSQIGQTTSFGEAQPLCTDNTKKCHQKNRRSYIKIVLNPDPPQSPLLK